MSEIPLNVNTNQVPMTVQTQSSAVVEPLPDGFIDTGILAEVAIPLIVPRKRGYQLVDTDGNNITFDDPTVPKSNRLPIFGFKVDPDFNHHLDSPVGPLVFPNVQWASHNVDFTANPHGMEHPLTRLCPSFMGWKGDLDFMVTVNSTALVQGQLSIIRSIASGSGGFKWKNFQLETEESDNCQIINLSSEKRVAVFSTYNETTQFVNSMFHYLQTRDLLKTSMNMFRNFIFIRADTDITTLSPNGGLLSFKIYMKRGDNFSFMYPVQPRVPDYQKLISPIDKRKPYPVTNTLTVAVRPYAGVTSNRNIQIDDTSKMTTSSMSNTTKLTREYPNTPCWVDFRLYTPDVFPEYTKIVGHRYGWVTVNQSFVVEVKIGDTWTAVKTYPMDQLKRGAVLFEWYCDPGMWDRQLPYYFP